MTTPTRIGTATRLAAVLVRLDAAKLVASVSLYGNAASVRTEPLLALLEELADLREREARGQLDEMPDRGALVGPLVDEQLAQEESASGAPGVRGAGWRNVPGVTVDEPIDWKAIYSDPRTGGDRGRG